MIRNTDKHKEEKILKAARALFAVRDYRDITIEEIAKKSGIGKGTVYLYFKNKDDIFFSLVEKSTLEAGQGLKAVISAQGEFNPILKESVRTLLRFVSGHMDIIRIMQKGRFSLKTHDCDALKKKMFQSGMNMVLTLSSLFSLRGAPKLKLKKELLGNLLFSMIISSVHFADVAGGLQGLKMDDRFADTLTDIFINGIVKKNMKHIAIDSASSLPPT